MAAFVLLVSCVSDRQKEVPPLMLWPMPPEVTRVKFLDYIIGSLDVLGGHTMRLKDIVFGEQGEVTFRKPNFVKARKGIMVVTDGSSVHVYDFKNKKYLLSASGIVGATGVEMSSDLNLYIGDTSRREVVIFDNDPGTKPRVFTSPSRFVAIGGMALDEVRNRLFVVDSRRHVIEIFDKDGEHIKTFGQRGMGPGEFNFPYDVEVGPDGWVYVLDSGNFRVQIFDADLKYQSAFGSVGLQLGAFARPKGIALSSDGFIFVTDAAFGNFQIFDKKGNVYLAVGESGTTPGKFLLPMGIDIDEEDKIYVVDQVNRRVQILQYMVYKEGEEGTAPVYAPGGRELPEPVEP